MLNLQDMKNIVVWLQSSNVLGKDVPEFIAMLMRLNTTIAKLEADLAAAAAAPSAKLPPEVVA